MAIVTASRLTLATRIQLGRLCMLLGTEGDPSPSVAIMVVFVFCTRMHFG